MWKQTEKNEITDGIKSGEDTMHNQSRSRAILLAKKVLR
jgi:hypothetical protein